MEFEVKDYTTSYKYFYNNDMCFITSAKLGSRFFKKFTDNLEFDKYNYPFSKKMYASGTSEGNLPCDKDGYRDAVIRNILSGTNDVTFIIRNPDLRFASGVSTMLGICAGRFFGAKQESGYEFMRSYFDNNISDNDYEKGIEVFKSNLKNFIDTNNGKYLKNIIFDFIVPHSLLKDAHVEYHHYMAYLYMGHIKEYGITPKWLELDSLDSYITSKQIVESGYYETKKQSQNSTSTTLYYSFVKLFLDTWKNENKQLDFHIKTEWEYYSKIKADYEVLL